MRYPGDVLGYFKVLAVWVERALAVIVLLGVLAFGVKTVVAAFGWDWSSNQTFYELIYRILLAVIAVEVARTLVTHDLQAILELLAFVVARKMLRPDVNPLEIVASVGAFIGLLAARRYFLPGAGPAGGSRDAGTPA